MPDEIILSNFGSQMNAVVIGASGGLGQAFVRHLNEQDNVGQIYALSRKTIDFKSDKVILGCLDYQDQGSIETAARAIDRPLHLILVATGLLHDDAGMMPEKALRDLEPENFQKSHLVNVIGPALVAKHFIPLMPRDQRAVFAALSARVGSIYDNQLGGWTAYRSSKAALNMVIKNAAIEVGRKNKEAIIVGLHPGTVKTALSAPFRGNVPNKKLFTPEYSAGEMLNVLNGLTPAESGRVFDYKGDEVLP